VPHENAIGLVPKVERPDNIVSSNNDEDPNVGGNSGAMQDDVENSSREEAQTPVFRMENAPFLQK